MFLASTKAMEGPPFISPPNFVMSLIQWLATKRSEKATVLSPQSSVKPNKSLDALLASAKRELGIDYANNYNFAVCGSSGVGKSAFINCILQLDGNDAAKVDIVECTPHISSYSNRLYPSVVLWDMPGSDVPNRPARTYFMDNKLYAFDCILILTSGSFHEVDILIATEAKKWNKSFAVVRTKADVDVKDIALRQKKSMKESANILREAVKKSFVKQLNMLASTPLFLISSLALSPHYPNPYAYNFSGRTDNSLNAMDEARLLSYMLDSVKPRFLSSSDWPVLKPIEGYTSPAAEGHRGFTILSL